MKPWLFVAAFLSLTPAAALADGLSGAWQISGNFNDVVKYTVNCKFTPTGAKFSGPCQDDHGQSFQAAGSMEGGKAQIVYDTTYEGTPVHLAYSGDVQTDGTLKGSVDAGIAQGVFTAARQ